MRYLRSLFAVIALAATAACSTPAPIYQPSVDNVLTLKRGGTATVRTGEFTSTADNRPSLRASPMVSPYNDSYGEYLRTALRLELTEAGRFSEQAAIEVGGVLVKNDIDANGFKTGIGQISARITVKRDGALRYDKEVSTTHEWPSSFPGMIAIPAARDNYLPLVQKLLKQLYADPEFIAAIK